MKTVFSATLCLWAAVVSSLHSQVHEHASPETLGSVTFSTSCNPNAQFQFNRAVALMHSFQFGSAIQGFNSVLKSDPTCAMADWGISLSSWQNPFAGSKSPAQLEQGLRAVERGRAIRTDTARERAYLDAVSHLYVDSAHISQPDRFQAYEQSMAAVSAAYPEDTEATIFYALAWRPMPILPIKRMRSDSRLERFLRLCSQNIPIIQDWPITSSMLTTSRH